MSLTQSVDLLAIAPPMLTMLGALVVLALDLLLPRGLVLARALPALGALGLAALSELALASGTRATFCVPGPGAPACSFVADRLTLVIGLVVLAGAFIVGLLSTRTVVEDNLPAGEHFALMMFSVTGALTLAGARDLLTLIVALETVSLPVYAMVGLRRDDRRSGEAALKVFLVSVAATAVTILGAALVYGTTGAVHLSRIAAALAQPSPAADARALAVVLVVAGFAFKVAVVPFHGWVPDTYTGAPLPVAAYLSVVSKAAGVAGLVLLLDLGLAPAAGTWSPILAVLAAATMAVGNIFALRQGDAVRLLAWSSVAQAGFIVAPLGAVGAGGRGAPSALAASIGYLAAYAVVNLGAFSVVTVLARDGAGTALAGLRGLGRREPFAAVALAFFLLCLAGLPPGLVGLFAKVRVFGPPVQSGVGWLAVVMAVNVVLGLGYYLRWVALLFSRGGPDAQPRRVGTADGLAVALALAGAVVFSVLPGALFGLAG